MNSDIVSILEKFLSDAKAGIDSRLFNSSEITNLLVQNPEFRSKINSGKIEWPGDLVTSDQIVEWLLLETFRTGEPKRVVSSMESFLNDPYPTWHRVIVSGNVNSQIPEGDGGWRFNNGIVAYTAMKRPDLHILSSDIDPRSLLFFDFSKDRDQREFTQRVRTCCHSLSFAMPDAGVVRPNYHTYAWDPRKPHPTGSLKGMLSRTENFTIQIVTRQVFEDANNVLRRIDDVDEVNRPRLMRVLDRFVSANDLSDSESRAIEMRVCLELILMGPQPGDNTFKVSHRAALLMGDNVETRKKIMNEVKSLYHACSTAVHGGEVKGKQAGVIREGPALLKRLISAWLDHKAQKFSDDDWAAVEFGGPFPNGIKNQTNTSEY